VQCCILCHTYCTVYRVFSRPFFVQKYMLTDLYRFTGEQFHKVSGFLYHINILCHRSGFNMWRTFFTWRTTFILSYLWDLVFIFRSKNYTPPQKKWLILDALIFTLTNSLPLFSLILHLFSSFTFHLPFFFFFYISLLFSSPFSHPPPPPNDTG
jgi:hypothetical protein